MKDWQDTAPWEQLTIRAKGVVDAIQALDVEHALRYNWEHGKTYCNIFVLDVIGALGLGAPTYWHDPVTGDKEQYGYGAEMSANLLSDWFATHGVEKKWQMTRDPMEAMALADSGNICVATWFNKKGNGHTAIVRPDAPLKVAQAGTIRSSNLPLARAFGAHLPEVRYWAK